jgi:hypothetical protein
MFTRDVSYLDEVHICDKCNTKMSCCEAPPVHVGDGLGWGSEVLFICLNNECPVFKNGWQHIELQYGHKGSYRCMELPGSQEKNVMMVASEYAFTGSEIDTEAVKKQNIRYVKEQEAVAALGTCVETHNLEPVLTLILDESANLANRQKAVACLKQLNELACIDPIRNHTFRDTSLLQECSMIISEILKAHFKKECPHCSELIKAQAQKCMHCKADL